MENLIILSIALCISKMTSAVDYHGYGGAGGFGGYYGHDDGLFKGYGGDGYYGTGHKGYGGPAVFYGYGGDGIGYGGHGIGYGGHGIGYGGHGGGYGGYGGGYGGYGGSGIFNGYGGLGHGGYYGNGGFYGLGNGFFKGYGGLGGYHGGGGVHKGHGGDGGYYGGDGGNAHYKFGYGVHDPHTHDVKAQQEYRKGDHVTGSYALKEPDGTERVVKYHSGPHSGFQATVERVGVAHHPARYGHGHKGYDLGGEGGTSYVSVTNWGDQGHDHDGHH